MTYFRRSALFFLLLVTLALPVAAREAITSFISDVTVNTDGSLDVRETITIRAEGDQIRHGILRDFPTTYKTKSGTSMKVGFEVVGVKRNGRDEPFSTESISNGKRIKIGDGNVFLDTGEYTYDIAYHTTRQIGFFDNFDELYWNATGNGWTFPIDKAKAIIRLPDGAIIQSNSIYTGAFGSAGHDARVLQSSGNRFSAETTQPLDREEGFTVAVSWQKGIVAPPTAAELQKDWIADNIGFFTLFATALGVGLYYVWAWVKVGRDPPTGVIAPLFFPPEGLGAAGVRYVWKQGYDDKAFAAGIVGLAVKGRMKIDGTGSDFIVTKQSKSNVALTRSEQALYAATPNSPLVLEQTNHTTVSAMRSALSSVLNDEYDATMFFNNFGWFAAGLALSVVGLLISGLLMPSDIAPVVLFTSLFS